MMDPIVLLTFSGIYGNFMEHGTFGEFHKRGCAKLDGLPWKIQLKLMIWGTLMTSETSI